MIDTGDSGALLGLDVGKGEHHATAVTPAGKKAFDKQLPNTEPKLRELFAKLQAKHSTLLVGIDQPASIGALPLAVARDMGCPVAYLPGLTMRRIAELEMLVGFDDDLAGEATRVANRLHGLLTQIHPSLERVLGPRLQHPALLTLLERFGSPTQIDLGCEPVSPEPSSCPPPGPPDQPRSVTTIDARPIAADTMS